jgi:hypothetical protein
MSPFRGRDKLAPVSGFWTPSSKAGRRRIMESMVFGQMASHFCLPAESTCNFCPSAGSGKSVLWCIPISLLDAWLVSHPLHSSLIIDNLQEDRALVVAYHYFDFRDTAKQTVRGLMCSLVFQIATSSDESFAYLQGEFSKPHGLLHPTDKELFTMLSDLLDTFRSTSNSVIIVIDALDECVEREDMHDFLQKLYNLELENLKLLFTSRPEAGIRHKLKDLAGDRTYTLDLHVENQHKDDLAAYISAKLKSRQWGEEVSMKAKRSLLEKANGM